MIYVTSTQTTGNDNYLKLNLAGTTSLKNGDVITVEADGNYKVTAPVYWVRDDKTGVAIRAPFKNLTNAVIHEPGEKEGDSKKTLYTLVAVITVVVVAVVLWKKKIIKF